LRVGFTLTKRVGHSTERNRIRRRLKAAMADLARDSRLPDILQLPLDIVLVGRRDCLSASYPTLLSDLERAIPAVAAPSAPRPVSSRPKPPRDPSSPRTRGARRRTTPDA
jgi:ribonuclease P protein component